MDDIERDRTVWRQATAFLRDFLDGRINETEIAGRLSVIREARFSPSEKRSYSQSLRRMYDEGYGHRAAELDAAAEALGHPIPQRRARVLPVGRGILSTDNDE
jgi:hypothetical protein